MSADAGVPSAPPRVFVHIGAPKTGTTFLQHVLFKNSEALAKAGVLYPYTDADQSFRSAHDFCGTAWFGHGADRFAGEWDLVAQRARDWTAGTVVISNELLAAASPDRVERGLAALAPAEVHVVFTARDLARQLVSDWQEHVKHRHEVTLEQFVDDLVELGLDAPKPFGRLFWGMHDAAYVLRSWARFVPADHIHVVTVPQSSGPSGALWTRFCAVVGLDPLAFDTTAERTNPSMGVAETELVRRMNAGTRIDVDSYDALVRVFLAEQVLGNSSTRLTLPPARRRWAEERSQTLINELAAAGYDVAGDLQDLMPVDPDVPYVSPTTLTTADLGPAAVKAATALLNQAGRLHESNAALQTQLAARSPGPPPSAAPRPVLRRAAGRVRRLARGAARRLLRSS